MKITGIATMNFFKFSIQSTLTRFWSPITGLVGHVNQDMGSNMIVIIVLLSSPSVYSADAKTELEQRMLDRIESLTEQLQLVQNQMQEMQEVQESLHRENQQLQSQFNGNNYSVLQASQQTDTGQTIQTSNAVVNAAVENSENDQIIDLSVNEAGFFDGADTNHVLSNPWYRNIRISGFGSIGHFNTGSAGSRDNAAFEVKESSLFIEGEVWEDVSYFLEFQINRLGIDPRSPAPNTGEAYVHFRNLDWGGDNPIGLKVGRVDLPFGEEYLWQDAIDNPLITNSIAYAYGWDEGVLAYSQWGAVNWIAAVTDGTETRSRDNNSQKAVSLKFYSEPNDPLYFSASFMHNDDSEELPLGFGGAHAMPVGTDLGSRDSFKSLAGDSESKEIGATFFELDTRYSFSIADRQAYLALAWGKGLVDDADSFFDREFEWFSVEPYLQISQKWYTLLRYSEIGTYDSNEGYLFGGKIFAKGLVSGGYDTEKMRRLGIGLGWRPNPRTRAKFEIGKDWLDVIDGSSLTVNDNRNFIGFEVAVGF